MIQELNKLINDCIEIPNINVKYSIGNNISDFCDPHHYELYIHIDKISGTSHGVIQSNQIVSFDRINTVYPLITNVIYTSLSVSDMFSNIKIEVFNINDDMYLEHPVAFIHITPYGAK